MTKTRNHRRSRTRRRSRNRKRSRTRTRRHKRTRNRRRKRGGLYDESTPLKKRDMGEFKKTIPMYEGKATHKSMMDDFKRSSNINEHISMAKKVGVYTQPEIAKIKGARRKMADKSPSYLQSKKDRALTSLMVANPKKACKPLSGGRRTRNRKRSRTRTKRRKRTRNRRRKRGGLYDEFTPLKRRDSREFNEIIPAYEGKATHKEMMDDFKRNSNIQDHVFAATPVDRARVSGVRRRHGDAHRNDIQTDHAEPPDPNAAAPSGGGFM